MRVIEVASFGGPEVLRPGQRPDPVAGSGEVAIRVAAADVLFIDTLIRSGWGREHFPVDPPYVPGAGVAGVVESVGDGVDSGWLGRRVIADTGVTGASAADVQLPIGGYAERAIAAETGLFAVPDEIDLAASVTFLHDGPTAAILADAAGFAPGRWVLVTAAAGGGGSLVVQLAKAAGARVIGAARGARKLEFVRELGAEVTVDYTEDGWQETVRRATGGVGVDVALDGGGAAYGAAAFEATADGGRFISYGTAGGTFTAIDPAEAARRNITVSGLFDLPSDPGTKRRGIERLLADAAAGRIRAIVGQQFDLAKATDAHTALADRTAVGKTILVP